MVVKERRLLLWQDVRIHLDRVAELGSFLELEAVVAPGAGVGPSRGRLNHLCAVLGIGPERLLSGSYADAVGAASAGAPRGTTIEAP